MTEIPPEVTESEALEMSEEEARSFLKQFIKSLTPRRRRDLQVPYLGAKERSDGHDAARKDLAELKRARKAQRRLNQFHK